MRKKLWRATLFLLLAAGLLYGIDEAVARLRARGSVEVDVYVSVIRKDNRIDFIRSEPQLEPCVNAVLPHAGMRACWYVVKHPRKDVDVGASRDDFWRH